ncbi:hypothetical protein NKDENANG_02412 [Candidatus Entotheonellaceae bacterium PAL068K]
MTASQQPEGTTQQVVSREIAFEAEVRGITPMLKLATVSRQGGEDHYSFACDEGAALGGLGSAPTPLAYLTAAIAF